MKIHPIISKVHYEKCQGAAYTHTLGSIAESNFENQAVRQEEPGASVRLGQGLCKNRVSPFYQVQRWLVPLRPPVTEQSKQALTNRTSSAIRLKLQPQVHSGHLWQWDSQDVVISIWNNRFLNFLH